MEKRNSASGLEIQAERELEYARITLDSRELGP